MYSIVTHPLSFLALIVVPTSSSTIEPRQATGSTPNSTIPIPSRYQLQAQVVPGYYDCGTDKNNLFVFSYHTGPGLGIAAMSKTLPSMYGYLNGTDQLFTYNGSPGPWPMIASHAPYREFNEISISVANQEGAGGFYFNETGLQLVGNTGWMICDWWYENPQLFALNGLHKVLLPKACSKVNLLPIAVNETEAYDADGKRRDENGI